MDLMAHIQRHALAIPTLAIPTDLWTEVANAYSAPGRHYHTLAHIADLVDHYDAVAKGPGWNQPAEVFLAILAHDIVYNVARTDNERDSAVWGRARATSLGFDGERVATLVEATTHGARLSESDPADSDLLHFLDCDLSILGAQPKRYDAYEHEVAAEYSTLYPGPLFRQGRKHFLEGMIRREHLFHTVFFRKRLEETARANLLRAYAAL